MPRLPGVVFGARLAAARAVSGDFFDFISLGDQQLGIVVGDVCGKGMPAAIYMALTRSLIRAEAPRCLPPGEALYCVNRHLLDIHDGGMFVTLVYGVLACDTGQFVYARAGHELPLVRTAGGHVYEAPCGLGHPLGILDEPQIDEQSLMLTPGTTLLLYTDGVSEAMDASGNLFGRKHLAELLESQHQSAAQELCDDLLETILAFEHNEHPTDDVTVVAMQAESEGVKG
jgi:sigma-B regulation protein RsbU (phosphoserine phosphatase)